MTSVSTSSVARMEPVGHPNGGIGAQAVEINVIIDVLGAVHVHDVRAAGIAATKLGIRRQSGGGMSGHFNFWDDGDVTFLGVGDDFADVTLRVEAAVPAGAVGGRADTRVLAEVNAVVLAGSPTAAPRARLGQKRVRQNLNPPAFVVHQMPVKRIHLLKSHGIHEFLHLLLAEKVA